MTADIPGTIAYLDDIIVASASIENHQHRLNNVFKKLQEYGLKVKLKKCSFMEPEIKYLGFIVDRWQKTGS